MEIKQDQLFKRFTTPTTKHKHEFQEICEDLEKDFGKLSWTLPHKPGFTNDKIRKGAVIARERNILTIPYLCGVIRNLP